MQIPRSHIATPVQKCLVLASAIFGVVILSVLIYRYERGRGDTDKALVGVWEDVDFMGSGPVYYRLNPDHTFRVFGDLKTEYDVYIRGLWYAGGDFLYLRRPWSDLDRDGGFALRIYR